MRFAVVLAALVCAVVAQNSCQPPPPKQFWYTQVFDHFDSDDSRTFQQRYLVYDDYYTSSPLANKPLFFCPGGESDVYGGYNHNGFMFQYGVNVGAFLLVPEHRFYGNSLPFGAVDSYTPENIDKLTIEQVRNSKRCKSAPDSLSGPSRLRSDHPRHHY